MRFVLGISGASGACFPLRLLDVLCPEHEVHVVVSDYGKRLLHDEGPGVDALARPGVVMHPHKDVGASIASGSFRHDGMVVLPCSSTSLAAIATGAGSNLLCRAAMVTMKERRRLILCHRETPLSLVDIENMRQVTLAGAVVCPLNPGYYLQPTSIDDLVDFLVARILDLLGVEHDVGRRWN